MSRPNEWNWIESSRPYAARRAFNVYVERQIYNLARDGKTPSRLEERFPLVAEAVDQAETELWNGPIVFVDESHYRRFLGNRSDWRAKDISDKVQGRVEFDWSAIQNQPKNSGSSDLQELFSRLTPLQREIMVRRHSTVPPMTDAEITQSLRVDGIRDERGNEVPRWKVTRERNRAETIMHAALMCH